MISARAIAVFLFSIGVATGAGFLRAQQKPLRVTARLVQIGVLVQDKHGNSLTGLTKDDFALFDGKKRQNIDFFLVETNVALPVAEPSQPPGTYTNEMEQRNTPSNLTVILLDSFNTGFMDRAFARSQIVKLLLTIQPQDRVALYALGAHLHVLHEFTSDASKLVALLQAYKEETTPDVDKSVSAPTGVFYKGLQQLAEDSGMDENQAFARDHAQATAEALRLIANHVGSLPGRKNLVWVSGNFPFNLDSDNLQRFDGQRLPFASDIELTVRALNNANMALYPVDARGLMDTGPSEEGRVVSKRPDTSIFGTMQILAGRAGGRAYYNTNAIMGSIRQAMDDSRVVYELGFYPSDVTWDGSFHAIHVKVNRPDLRLQAREGYFALPEPNLAPEAWAELIAETARGALEATEIRIRVQVVPADPKDERKLKLSVSLDTQQFDFLQRNGQWNDSVETAVIQLDDRSRILRTSPLVLPLTLDPDTYEQLVKQGLSFIRELQILPGAAELRVIVRDGGNGRIGSVRIPLAAYFSGQSKR